MLDTFRQHTLSAVQAAAQLGLSPSRLYALATAYNTARARKQPPLWTPGASGGDHATAWPQPVQDLLKKRLACSPPCPYSFAASEALRLHAFKLDRAQVRRWALAHKLAHAVPPKKVLAAVRRWQRAQIGELWQLDASPHRWFPHSKQSFPMLNMLDDCSRLFTGSKIYERELLLAYFDFLPAALLAHGRPLQIYVDYHSIFFTNDPDALTQLGWALKFYDISFLYAPTPQAKGKIERAHQYWQGRLPAYFASEKITEIAVANPQIDALRAHRNAQEVHRELGQTPQLAWDQARQEKRSVLRPAPRCPWWDYVWSVRTVIKVGSGGACPSAPNACGSKNRRQLKWCCASTLQGITPSWPPHPIPSKNPHSSSPIAPNELSCFENYATPLEFMVAVLEAWWNSYLCCRGMETQTKIFLV